MAVDGLVLLHERVVNLPAGLAHQGQHAGGDVLGGHLQLAADVVLAQFPEKCPVLVQEQVVVAQPGADEHLFDAGQRTDSAQDGQ